MKRIGWEKTRLIGEITDGKEETKASRPFGKRKTGVSPRQPPRKVTIRTVVGEGRYGEVMER